MKNRKEKKPNYTTLVWKVFLKILLIVVIAIVVVIALRFLLQGSMGNWLVAFFQAGLHLDYESAHELYWNVVRRNLEYIIFIAVAVMIFFLSRFLLSQFAKYFNEISDGLDQLVGEKGGEIRLSSEMSAMERKLNAVKRTLEERESEARQAEQRKNDIVTYLAHDLKTPLTSVIGYLSLLDEAPDMPPEQKAKYVNITFEKALRLERLVDEFFEIARYNLQTISLSKGNVDLYYMLAQMADEFYPLLAAKGKQVALRAPEDLAVFGDPDHLARVFNNILKNAAAYSPDGSVIEIEAKAGWAAGGGANATDTYGRSVGEGIAKKEKGAAGGGANADADTYGRSVGESVVMKGPGDGMVSITFRNEGNIAKEKLDAIFEKFYRLDTARSADTGGAGLGLAIAKEIVALHGGNIFADSDGAYTVFTVELPAL